METRSGAAGVAGQVADPMLFKIDLSEAEKYRAVRTAAAWGADVISMSFGGDCNQLCRILGRVLTPFDDAVADGSKAVFVASAGNGDSSGNGYDVGDPHFVHPCLEDHVLCIGALEDDVITPKGYSNFEPGRAVRTHRHPHHVLAGAERPRSRWTGRAPDSTPGRAPPRRSRLESPRW